MSGSLRIGIDIGGTFTDIVAYEALSGRHTFLKTPSTPADYLVGMREGLARLFDQEQWAPEFVELFFHGTTIATNTLLEQTGAAVGLITTQGFRDLLEIGRTERPPHDLYNLMMDRPRTLVRRRHRLTVRGRLSAAGDEIEPLDEAAVREAARQLSAAGIEAIAIVFINAYAGGAHERRARELVREVAPDVYVVISSEVNPQIKEFERTSTTVLSAYVGRKVSRYVNCVESLLISGGISAPLHVMQASGGAMTRAAVADNAIRTILSGPAAGVIAAKRVAAGVEQQNVVTFDMGGTSTDVSLIRDGAHRIVQETREGGYYIRVPTMDIVTIGAGGGSIAAVDSGGALKVGPKSAGADPGPACYGRGEHPTVTDANVVLGYIDPENFLGGEIKLDAERAWTAIARYVAEPLGMNVETAAAGIVTVANATMIRAIRRVSIERGLDVRSFALLPFGGAGNLHGAMIARELGMARTIVPIHPGVLSACGLVEADLEYQQVRSVIRSLDEVGSDLPGTFAELDVRCLAEMAKAGFPSGAVRITRSASLRYRKQVRDVTIDLPDSLTSTAELRELFCLEHERLYGFRTDEPIEIVDVRVAAVHPLGSPVEWTPPPVLLSSMEPIGQRQVWSPQAKARETWPIHARDLLPRGATLPGPMIIEQKETNIVVLPGDVVTVAPSGILIIEPLR